MAIHKNPNTKPEESTMKKIVMFVVVLVLIAGTVCAQADLPTEAEAARVIEGYFRCLGNGDMKNLSDYFTKKAIEEKVIEQYAVISAALDETQKKEFTSFKADIIEMRPIYDRATNTVFVRCFLAENSLSEYMDLVKENDAWKLR
jgi:hypothetical protein